MCRSASSSGTLRRPILSSRDRSRSYESCKVLDDQNGHENTQSNNIVPTAIFSSPKGPTRQFMQEGTEENINWKMRGVCCVVSSTIGGILGGTLGCCAGGPVGAAIGISIGCGMASTAIGGDTAYSYCKQKC